MLVINKPSGLAVHGGSGLNFGLIECLRQLRPQDRYLELVHRLDRDTSGFDPGGAPSPRSCASCTGRLRGDGVDKRYLALVAGRWPKERRIVEAPLQKNIVQSGERMVKVAKEGRASVTGFAVLEQFPEATLVEARPHTGRTHQIRVHAQFAGHPILGDDKYMDDATQALARKLGVKRLFLHARALSFTLPDQPRLQLEAPLEPELEIILERMRK